MAGYFSANEQKRELSEKEILKKIENVKNKIQAYCIWYSEKINMFKQEIATLDIKLSFGIEIIDGNLKIDEKKFDEISFYDMATIKGIAFDTQSRRLIYYYSRAGIYDYYNNSEEVDVFHYEVIPFHELRKAVIDIDSSTIIQSTISKNGVISRSIIGGLIAGEAGAIIGGLSGSEVSQTSTTTSHNSCDLIIYTVNEKYPVIKLSIEKYADLISKEMVIDVSEGILSEKAKENYFSIITNTTKEYKASSGNYTPCEAEKVYDLVCERNIFNEDLEKYNHELKILNKTFDPDLFNKYCIGLNESVNLNKTIKNCQELVRKIEAIIMKSDRDTKQNTGINIIDQLEKLVKIKLDGFITDEEFVLFKKKLIEN